MKGNHKQLRDEYARSDSEDKIVLKSNRGKSLNFSRGFLISTLESLNKLC